MDWSAIFQIIVDDIGVIPTILILGLGFVSWRLWLWGSAQSNARIDDLKENSEQMREAIRIMDDSRRAWEERSRG